MLADLLSSLTALSLPGFGFAAFVIAFAYVVFGLTGFGSSIVAVPLLTQVLALRTVVPMMLFFDLVAGTLLGLNNRRHLQLTEIKRLMPSVLLGMALGLGVLLLVPERVLLGGLGIFVLAHVVRGVGFRPAHQAPSSPRLAPLYGLFGGIFTSTFGTGGPIYTLYLAGRLPDPLQLRATISALLVITAVLRLLMFALAGLYADSAMLILPALLMPFALAGYAAGAWLNARISAARVVSAVWALLALAGLGLVYRNVFAPF